MSESRLACCNQTPPAPAATGGARGARPPGTPRRSVPLSEGAQFGAIPPSRGGRNGAGGVGPAEAASPRGRVSPPLLSRGGGRGNRASRTSVCVGGGRAGRGACSSSSRHRGVGGVGRGGARKGVVSTHAPRRVGLPLSSLGGSPPHVHPARQRAGETAVPPSPRRKFSPPPSGGLVLSARCSSGSPRPSSPSAPPPKRAPGSPQTWRPHSRATGNSPSPGEKSLPAGKRSSDHRLVFPLPPPQHTQPLTRWPTVKTASRPGQTSSLGAGRLLRANERATKQERRGGRLAPARAWLVGCVRHRRRH